MAKRNIKETLLSTLVHGEEVLENIRVMRNCSDNKITDTPVTRASDLIHPKKLTLVLNEMVDLNDHIRRLRFVSKDGYLPPFQAGQYIALCCEIDGCRVSRPYSLASSPKQRGYYEIAVERVDSGFVSKYIHTLKVGDEIEAKGPAGHFVYNPVFHKTKSLFIAGGSSITPYLSMIQEIFDTGENRDIVLIYGAKNLKNAIYNDMLEDYAKKFDNFKYCLVLDDEPSYKGEKGLIDAKLIKKVCPDYLDRTSYVCGPTNMHNFCREELIKLGLKTKDIRDEMFGAPMDVTKEDGWPSNLKGDEVFNLTVGDKVIPAIAKEPILVALERAGIRVNVCCRCGECSLCRVKLVDGKVFLAKGMLLRYADEKYGYIHSCKAYPISDLKIEL